MTAEESIDSQPDPRLCDCQLGISAAGIIRSAGIIRITGIACASAARMHDTERTICVLDQALLGGRSGHIVA
eukprot:CAMPEP_0170626836 /NCGR_PEP_ID=MMETSP0224-20130122/31592_2 /TAXON_ID=285029 /ORGANISM="Togula jolla, Strain CCCM 725" /LENGTH=71 /DNA_ID=CAMNT_0010953679 /DNA_START=906 /DNA_END=1119 /DNA_ORIENTATION=-